MADDEINSTPDSSLLEKRLAFDALVISYFLTDPNENCVGVKTSVRGGIFYITSVKTAFIVGNILVFLDAENIISNTLFSHARKQKKYIIYKIKGSMFAKLVTLYSHKKIQTESDLIIYLI